MIGKCKIDFLNLSIASDPINLIQIFVISALAG